VAVSVVGIAFGSIRLKQRLTPSKHCDTVERKSQTTVKELSHLAHRGRTRRCVWLRLRTPARLALRAEIVLLAADGATNQGIAALRASRKTVSLWRRQLPGRPIGGRREGARVARLGAKVDEAVVRLILRNEGTPANAPH
jgi:hypothetical protein